MMSLPTFHLSKPELGLSWMLARVTVLRALKPRFRDLFADS
jgi:hypothetical protein